MFLSGFLLYTASAQQRNFWTGVSESSIAKNIFQNRFKPSAYRLFHLRESEMVMALRQAPSERSVSSDASPFIVSLPNAEGMLERFTVVEAPVMDAALSARYPGIKSFAGKGLDHAGSEVGEE